MWSSIIRVCTLLVFASTVFCDDDTDKLWIFLDKVNLYECQGVTNVWVINKEDVFITDKNGDPQYWFLEAPGEYYINFNKIGVKKPVPNLSGNLATTIQVPLVSVGSASFDFPYQILPQKKLFNSGCDNESGVFNVASEKRDYCRYCDLCEVEGHVENSLGNYKKHKYVDTNGQESFQKVCTKINSDTYQMKKKVAVPGKKELQDEANRNFPADTLNDDTKKKFKVGKGRLQVFLNAMSSDQAPQKANAYYPNKKGCECCMKDAANNKIKECPKGFLSLFGGQAAGAANLVGNTDPCSNCNNEYVKTCVKGNSQVAGCYRAEFNFRITDKRAEFEEYKKQIDYDKQKADAKAKQAKSGTVTATATGGGNQPPATASTAAPVQPQPSGGGGGGGVQSCDTCSKDACVSKIKFGGTGAYCKSYWDNGARGYCCSKCPDVCST